LRYSQTNRDDGPYIDSVQRADRRRLRDGETKKYE
jgi:hypothetical protein